MTQKAQLIWQAVEALPGFDEAKLEILKSYMPSRDGDRPGDRHWLTFHCLRWWDATTVKAALEPLEWWDQKAAERRGAIEWFTPRAGQEIVWRGQAGYGKRQWVVAAPVGLVQPWEMITDLRQPEPKNEGPRLWVERAKIEVRNVRYRLLFHRGGHRDYREAFVIDGAGNQTLTIYIK